MENKAFLIRYGAYGDHLILTPVLKRLKELGYYIVYHTNKRGREVLLNNPNVDEFLDHDEKMPIDELPEYWKKLQEQVKADRFINFSESLECNVALHPIQPEYNYTKEERISMCNRNYYDATESWAGLEGCQKLPELYFTPTELKEAATYIQHKKFNILWQLSGSAKQKVYPWTDYVVGEILKNHKDIHFITTGDERCQILESVEDKDITNLSGRISIRVAMALTSLVNLVISPDTGILHAAGCFPTPKIGLLGHTTINNITKYFVNDYSLEADCACAPCMRLIYDHQIQCPRDFISGAAWCMAYGITPERLYARVDGCIRESRGTSFDESEKTNREIDTAFVPDMRC